MAINPPVDATQTPEWAALQKHYDELQVEGVSLKKWFAEDAERVEKLSFDAGDLHFDLSKNLITARFDARSKTRASTSLTVSTPSRTCARCSTRSTLSLTTCVPASGPV